MSYSEFTDFKNEAQVLVWILDISSIIISRLKMVHSLKHDVCWTRHLIKIKVYVSILLPNIVIISKDYFISNRSNKNPKKPVCSREHCLCFDFIFTPAAMSKPYPIWSPIQTLHSSLMKITKSNNMVASACISIE